jgi:hypothetical protein
MSVRNSLNRRGPPTKDQTTLGVQAPPRNFMQVRIGHIGSGGELFLRIFSAMAKSPTKLPDGYSKMQVTINHVVTKGNLPPYIGLTLGGRCIGGGCRTRFFLATKRSYI